MQVSFLLRRLRRREEGVVVGTPHTPPRGLAGPLEPLAEELLSFLPYLISQVNRLLYSERPSRCIRCFPALFVHPGANILVHHRNQWAIFCPGSQTNGVHQAVGCAFQLRRIEARLSRVRLLSHTKGCA